MSSAAPAGVDATAPTTGIVVPGRVMGVTLLTLVYILNFMDRQILAVLIEPIKADIALTDTQVGLLTGTLFAVFYGFITIPIAMMADRTNRIRIVAIGCFLWSIFTGISGLAMSFLALAVARIGVAFGEAGGVAPSLSVLGDYFSPRRRVFVIALFTCASPIGILAGVMVGGLVADVYGWRAVFIGAAIAGLILVPILIKFAPEPPRGNFEPLPDPTAKAPSFGATLLLFVRRPTLVWMAVSCGLFAMIANGLITWVPALLMRGYGATVRDVALYYGPVVGISLAIGLFSSGATISWFAKRSLRAYTLIPAAAMLICAPLFAATLSAGTWQMALVWMAVPLALINFVVPPALTLVQNLAPANVRSTASAILMLVLNLVGIGLGPLMVGVVSDMLTPTMGTDGLRYAMLITIVPTAVLTSASLLIATRYIVRDHERVASNTVPGEETELKPA